MGISAGGSVALAAFVAQRRRISKMINLCGRLRVGESSKIFTSQQKKWPLFIESVVNCENAVKKLTKTDTEKILVIKPLWDELVPVETMTLSGAITIHMPLVEHVISTLLGIYLYRKRIRKFLSGL